MQAYMGSLRISAYMTNRACKLTSWMKELLDVSRIEMGFLAQRVNTKSRDHGRKVGLECTETRTSTTGKL